jgi:aspartate aminotransferase
MYLLEGADEARGVACLGGECFGEAGRGFLRLSCAQPDERIAEAFAFMVTAFKRVDRVEAYLRAHPEFQLVDRYEQLARA